MHLRWLIDRCLGRKHQRPKILGRMSVQVKAPDSNNGTGSKLAVKSIRRGLLNQGVLRLVLFASRANLCS